MSLAGKRSLTAFRKRQKRQGRVRIEVSVDRADAPLLRDIAGALSDPARGSETRAFLRARFEKSAEGFKALLAQAPLDGIDLDRPRDMGRKVEL